MFRRRVVGAVAAGLGVALASVSPTLPASAAAEVSVMPASTVDPGVEITVANADGAACAPSGATAAYAAVTVRSAAGGSAVAGGTGDVTPEGRWSVALRVPPATAPGAYRIAAECRDETRTGYRTYPAVDLTVREARPGAPRLSTGGAPPGTRFQVGSGEAACPPPGPDPARVRVMLRDAGGVVRAAADEAIDPGSGGWSATLNVPDLAPQRGTITAACHATTSAAAPYARYIPVRFEVAARPAVAATTTTAGAPASTVQVNPGLPASPRAVAIIAEPAYTG